MAQAIGGGKVKLNSGQVVTAQTGGWYDGQQYWNGSLSNPGEFNPQSGSQGAAPVQAKDVSFISQQRAKMGLTPTAQPQQQQQQQQQAPQPSQPSQPVQMPQRPTINLQDIYSKALETARTSTQAEIQSTADQVNQIQQRLQQKREQLAQAESQIADNPFYGEATRVGRIAKLRDQYNQDVANVNQELQLAQNRQAQAENKRVKAEADAQVALNIASQQYNIQSQEYQNNLNYFTNLLGSGALNNASPQDIANISTSTGMSTSMIQSIIDQSRKSKEVPPQLVPVSDNEGQKIVAIDANGNIINTTIVGRATPQAVTGGATAGGVINIQKTFDRYKSDISNILKQADVMNQGGNVKKADKKLAPWEVAATIQQVSSLTGAGEAEAAEIVAKAMSSYGYGTWKP